MIIKIEGRAALKLDGMCDGCQYADMELDQAVLFSDGYRQYVIKCIHYEACDHIKDHYEAILEEMSE